VRLIVATAVVILLAATGCGGERSSGVAAHDQDEARTGAATTKRKIDASVSVPRGDSGVIYLVHGRSAVIGRFIGTCPERAEPRTAYEPTRQAADGLAAVDGRGASRAGTVLFGRGLHGGHQPSGLEQWLIRMSRESEEVTVNASLEVVRQRGSPDCTFWLYGSLILLTR
jgi:hypothetical protein